MTATTPPNTPVPDGEPSQPQPRQPRQKLPKGAYPLPNGNYVIPSPASSDIKGRRIRAYGELKSKPDIEALVRALMRSVE